MSTLCNAIRGRQVLSFSYDGGTRTVEPYCHGTSLAGHEVLRGFQRGGFSASGDAFAWKLFEVSKISKVWATGATFVPTRPGYNPQDKGMTTIHCHV